MSTYTSAFINQNPSQLKSKENELMVSLLVTDTITKQILHWFKTKFLHSFQEDLPLYLTIEFNSIGGLFNIYYAVNITYNLYTYKFRFYILSILEINETWPVVLNMALHSKEKLIQTQEENKNILLIDKKLNHQLIPFPFNINQDNICIDVFLILTKVIAESDILGVSFTDLSRLFTTRGFHIDKMV